MIDRSSANARRSSASARALTAREAEVLRLVAAGLTAKEIAHQLGVTDKSVETYKARGIAKLGLRTRHEIVRYAREQGWPTNI